MSRAQVRGYVQAWLDPSAGGAWATSGNPAPPPDSLDKVWTSFPKRIDFREFARVAGQDTRCQLVVFIRGQDETREAIGGDHSGKKKQTYDVVVQGFIQSHLPNADAVMDAVDTIADAVVNRLRADHRLGQDPTVIFRAAEPSIRLDFGEPFTNQNAATEQWFSASFPVEQWITA